MTMPDNLTPVEEARWLAASNLANRTPANFADWEKACDPATILAMLQEMSDLRDKIDVLENENNEATWRANEASENARFED